jgi:multiple sugar transport system permease protein
MMSYRSKRSSEKWLPLLFLLPVLVIILVITIYPFIFAIWMSLTDMGVKPLGQEAFVGLRNYITIFTDTGTFLPSILTTLIFVAGAVTVEFLLGLGMALLINREFRGRGIVIPILLLPMVVSPIAVGLIYTLIYNVSYGPLNYLLLAIGAISNPIAWVSSARTALPSVIAADIWEWTPYMFLILLAALQTVSPQLIEAARVDGASSWTIFRRLTLPIAAPIMSIAILIRVIDAFKLLDILYMLTKGGPGISTDTMSWFGFNTGFTRFDLGLAAAASIVLLFMVMIPMQVLLSRVRRGR